MSLGRDGKALKCQHVCAQSSHHGVCAPSSINSLLKTWQMSHVNPFSSSRCFGSVSEIVLRVWKSEHSALKWINSFVCLPNSFKGSVFTDLIMSKVWKNQFCYWVIVWELVWENEKKKTSVYTFTSGHSAAASRLNVSWELPSSPSQVLSFLLEFLFYCQGVSRSLHAVDSHEALQLPFDIATLTTGLNEKLWRLLSPVWPVYSPRWTLVASNPLFQINGVSKGTHPKW